MKATTGIFQLFKKEDKKSKKILKLKNTVKSQSGHYAWMDVDRVELSDFNFTDEEYQAAFRRYCKDNQKHVSSYLNAHEEVKKSQEDFVEWIDSLKPLRSKEVFSNRGSNRSEIALNKFSPFVNEDNTESFWRIFLKAVLSIAFPGLVYSEEYSPYAGAKYKASREIVVFIDELEAEIYEDLVLRKVTSILKNVISRIFKRRRLLFVQSHLMGILYEYFDIVFSLKERVVVEFKSCPDLFKQQLFINNYEKRQYHRALPITC